MVTTLGESTKPMAREAGDLIGGNLNRKKRESYNLEMHGMADYVVITKNGCSI